MAGLFLIRLPRVLAGLCLLAGVAINFANVVGRYFFGAPIFWAEEGMIFLIVWSIFLGMIPVTAEREHLRMDLVVSALGPRMRTALERLALAATVVTLAFLGWQSWQSLARLGQFDMRSIALDVPMVIPHGAVLVGAVGGAVAALALLARARRE